MTPTTRNSGLIILVCLVTAIKRIPTPNEAKAGAKPQSVATTKPQITGPDGKGEGPASSSRPLQAKAETMSEAKTEDIRGSVKESERKVNVEEYSQGLAPRILFIAAALVTTIFFGMCLLYAKLNTAHVKAKSYLPGFSPLSTSSSEDTSSATTPTDQELKFRMEKFEARLEEHKRRLGETRLHATSDGTSEVASDGTRTKNARHLAMAKIGRL